MKFESLIRHIPDYKRFYTVDEHNERTHELVKQYPKTVRISQEGRSRKGEPIPVLEIGRGSRQALLFGCPHPNEPIGAMMLDCLTEFLAREEALLQELDYTWHIIKIIDVDGTRLNQGWFDDRESIASYARNFYRPPGYQQVEWTFPVCYKTLNFQSPLPETQLLMQLIETYKPDFMYSLHNSGFGGAYYYISQESPELYPLLHEVPAYFDIPLSLGEPEIPFFEHLAPAIFKLFKVTDLYDHLAQHSAEDPAKLLNMGAGSDEYAERMANTYSLVAEVPYFYDGRVTNEEEIDISRKESLQNSLNRQKEYLHFLESVMDRAGEYLDRESPFFSTMEETLQAGVKNVQAEENWLEADAKLTQKATIAQDFDNRYGKEFYRVLGLGMMQRLLRASEERFGQEELLLQARSDVESEFKRWINYLETNLEYKAIPIPTLVGIQLLAGLHTADYVQKIG